jgi:hypothetical protein
MRAPRLLPSALIALGVLLAAVPAGAHSDTGNLSVDVLVRRESAAEVQVALSYASDGHAAEDATVTASATGPDGASAGPVTLAPIGLGGYRGELTLPRAGTWTVRAESADPTASAETTVTLTESRTPDTSGPGTLDPDVIAVVPADGDDGGSGVVPWVVVGVVLAVAAGGGALLLRRRHG